MEIKKNNQSGEDYLETILLLEKEAECVHRIEIAKRMGVSQAAVNKAVKLLIERGQVREDGKHLRLTENGKAYASSVYERHCLIRSFLEKLGVSEATAEADACALEHLVSEETVAKIKEFMQ